MTRNHEKLLIGVLAGKTGFGGSSSLSGPSPQVLTLRLNA